MPVTKSKPGLGQKILKAIMLMMGFGIPFVAAIYFRPTFMSRESERTDEALDKAFHSVFENFENQPWREPVWSHGITLYPLKKRNPETDQTETAGYASLLSSSEADAGVILTGWDQTGAWIGEESFQSLPLLKPDRVHGSFKLLQETFFSDRAPVPGERERSET